MSPSLTSVISPAHLKRAGGSCPALVPVDCGDGNCCPPANECVNVGKGTACSNVVLPITVSPVPAGSSMPSSQSATSSSSRSTSTLIREIISGRCVLHFDLLPLLTYLITDMQSSIAHKYKFRVLIIDRSERPFRHTYTRRSCSCSRRQRCRWYRCHPLYHFFPE